MRTILFIFVVLAINSCAEKKTNKASQKNVSNITVDSVKKIYITKIGELRFRRSYALKADKYEEIRKTNPEVDDTNPDTVLLKKFQNFGIVNEKYALLLKRFKSVKILDYDKPNAEFELIDKIPNKLDCKIVKIKDDSQYILSASDSSRTSQILLDGFYVEEGLKFMLLDIIPGGYKEIVILNNYYISNGDNSDIFIYELKNAN